jgi:hypothetical protein
MKHLKALCPVLALLVMSATAHAKSLTGMNLKEKCTADEPVSPLAYQNESWCEGFIYGFLSFGAGPSLPDDVTVGQFELVLIKYMNEHPEKLNLPAENILRLTARSGWGNGGAK